MITKGIAGYRETAAKLDNQATLRERVEASLNTLGNKWEAAGGSFTNAMASIGETVAPVLKILRTGWEIWRPRWMVLLSGIRN